MELVQNRCKPTFIHEFALSKLRASGYRIAVCSNSIRTSIQVMMEKARLNTYLEFFLSNEDVARSKPDPEIYLNAMERLGLRPEECLVVEDNENGIKAAKASGAHLLTVKEISEVNFSNISNRIGEIEGLLRA